MLSTPFSGVDVTSNADDDDVWTIFDDGNRGFTNDDGACLAAAETTVAASRAKARKGERMMMKYADYRVGRVWYGTSSMRQRVNVNSMALLAIEREIVSP